MKQKILLGQFCPDAEEISLDFYLVSDVLGEATETIKIPVKPVAASDDDE